MALSEIGYADINGARIYYEVAGAGQPLVLVHAGIADSRMWNEQFDYFAERFKVVRYDLRGYGKTAMVAGDYAHRGDLYELLKFLGIEKAILLGCSIGGATSIDFALEHPEMVAALVLVGSGLSGHEYSEAPPKQEPEAETAFKRGDYERVSELEVEVWVDGPQRTPDQVDPAIRALVHEMNLITVKNSALNLGNEQPLDPPAAGRLSEIHAPTLVIVGDIDEAGMVNVAEVLAKSITGAQKVVIHGTAHVPNMEQPAEFNRIVVEFLDNLP
jgi:pimeloyl-ACP methyl ester carboxylesterase